MKAPRRRANFIGSDGGIYVAIQKCMDGCIFFEETQDVNIRLTYNIKFVSNRVTSRTTQNALKLMDDHGLRRFFQTFDANVGVAYKLQLMGVEQKVAFEWENPKVAENVEQMTAVLNIVNCAAYPSPHVIFGPRKIFNKL